MKNHFKDSSANSVRTNLQIYLRKLTDIVQFMHSGTCSVKSEYWFSVLTLNCEDGYINIFDSAYNDIDNDSKALISRVERKTIVAQTYF